MKKRIAILGGGAAALTAAFELTRRPGHRDRYEITVYQMGHRLGGKGASGVDLARNARLEEHGLHILWGFYDNVFRMMRECYAELGRPLGTPFATWEDATLPDDHFVVSEGKELWTFRAPRHDGFPGDVDASVPVEGRDAIDAIFRATAALIDGARQIEVPGVIDRALRLAFGGVRARLGARLGGPGREEPRDTEATALEAALRDLIIDAASGVLHGTRAVQGLSAGVLDVSLAALFVERLKKGSGERQSERQAERRADRAAASWLLRRSARHGVALAESGPEDRHRRLLLDLLITAARGMIADDLLTSPRDWFRLDDVDFRVWLRRHGARPETVDSALIEGLYAALFAAGTEIGAGTLLHGALRIAFGHSGSLLYRMRSGMGETVFAPLYQVLAARGVRFAFFHAVDHLELSEDRRRVERVVLDRAATPKNERYQPLIDVDGLGCWPTEPLHDQLVEGEALRATGEDLESWWNAAPRGERITLEAGKDFDVAVLGISLGALPEVCRELVEDEQNPRFSEMVRRVVTTQTQAAQLWFRPGLSQLGWRGVARPIVIPHRRPFDAWADMTHLLERERWAGQATSVAYLTGRLPDDEPPPPRGPSDYLDRQRARVRENLEAWIGRSAVELWPAAAGRNDPSEIAWSWLADPLDRTGADRLDAQYWCAPKNPSDRYVLSLPGTVRFRLRADESGYSNLVLAGDWTRTSMSGGCLEGAVMGGIQAARAIDPGARSAMGDWLELLERPEMPRAGVPRDGVPRDGGNSSSTSGSSSELRVAAVAGAAIGARSLPRYVPRDGELLALPPIGLGISMHAFVLSADVDRIAALCDAELNLGGPTRYRPLGPLAILYFSRVDNFPIEDPIGWVPEADVGIWIPLVAGRTHGGRFEAERVVLYTPYIWVDHPLALTIGRAVYGFRKELGEIAMPESAPGWTDGAPPSFSVDTWVVPRFAARTRVEKQRLLTVRGAGSSAWQQAKAHAQSGAQVLGGLFDQLTARGGIDLGRRMLDDARRGVRMVYLKQLPDVVDGRRACYQAVIEADVAFTGQVRGGGLLSGFEVEIARFDSHRIMETLGLGGVTRADATGARIQPLVAAWSRFEARIGPGSVMWESR